jgi:hypothetical protein
VDGNPYYKYWNFGSYWDHEGKLGSEDSDLHAIQRVSIVNGELLGYFTVRADRATMEGYSVALLSFNPGKINLAFARDAISFIESLFDDYGMKVLRFVVVDGNPAKSLYDRWVGNHYGRYVGYQEHGTIIGGEILRTHLYEITERSYRENKYK